MEQLDDWHFVVGALIASFVIGMSRGGFAGGIGFVGVLIMTQLVPVTTAAAFVLPLLCIVDPLGIYVYRKHVHWPSIKVLLLGGIFGVLIGAMVFYIVSDTVVRLAVAGLSIYMVAERIFNRSGHAEARVYSPAIGVGLGACAGLTSFIVHAGLPPAAAYLLPQKLSRYLFLGTTSVFFTSMNYLKLVPYAVLGILDLSLLSVSTVFMPVAFGGFFVGKWLAPRMSDRMFYFIMYVSVCVLGSKLAIEAVMDLLA